MQNRRTHIRKLPQFAVCHRADRARIFHNARICHQTPRNVGPVLVKFRFRRLGNDRSRNVRPAARKGADRSVRHHAVEARDNRAFMLFQLFPQLFPRLFGVETAVFFKENDRLRIDEIIFQILCQNQRRQILPAACGEIPPRVMIDPIADIRQFARYIIIQAEVADNRVVTLGNLCKVIGDILPRTRHFVATVEHIGYLDIVGGSLSGRGRDHISARGIRTHDFANSAELRGIRQRRTAELHRFDSHSTPLFVLFLPIFLLYVSFAVLSRLFFFV